MIPPFEAESSEDQGVTQDAERILQALRGGRAAELPARPRAWQKAVEIETAGFSVEKAKLLYATWRLVKLAQRGAAVSGDATLYADRIEEFQHRLGDFLG